jgi:hypothetical protein
MTVGFLFWLLMILWLIAGVLVYWPAPGADRRAFWPVGGHVLIWVLLFLLGWQVFGWPIKS